MLVDIRTLLQELADAVKAEILKRLRGPIGINRSVGFNTLQGSHLEESIDVYVTAESQLAFVIADYFSFVAGGRRHGLTPRNDNVYGAIQRWVREKHVQIGDMTENQVIWAVLNKLKNRDLPPRAFVNPDYDYTKDASEVIPFLSKMVDEWMDDFFNTIMKKTDKYFDK